jgi:hypothetical protein
MVSYTGTPTTLVAGDTSALVTKFNDHRDALKGLSSALTTWAPTPSGGITAFGNAVVVAKYQQVDKWVRGYVKVTMGTTTTFAAAAVAISLPVTAHADQNPFVPLGSAFFFDNSVGTTSRTFGTAWVASTTVANFNTPTAGGNVTNLVPWTWATSDILAYTFEYEAA